MLRHRKTYKKLKSIIAIINEVQTERERFDSFKDNTQAFGIWADKNDKIYKTAEKYGAKLILPVNQDLDPGIGKDGECFGYTIEWLQSILKQKKAFGIMLDTDRPPFTAIAYNSPAGKKYPELNHLARLTKNISTLQRLQYDPSIRKKMAEGLVKNTKIAVHTYVRQSLLFNDENGQHFNNLADDLVTISNKQSTNASKRSKIISKDIPSVCEIGLLGKNAHSVGFCKFNNSYHFFDANAGWFRFKNNEANFKAWLTVYLKQNYNEYTQYRISEVRLKEKKERKLGFFMSCFHSIRNFFSPEEPIAAKPIPVASPSNPSQHTIKALDLSSQSNATSSYSYPKLLNSLSLDVSPQQRLNFKSAPSFQFNNNNKISGTSFQNNFFSCHKLQNAKAANTYPQAMALPQ